MIATARVPGAVIPRRRRPRLIAAFGAVVVLAGCLADRENTLSRSARAREVTAELAERKQQERDLYVLEATAVDTQEAIERAAAESVRRSSELRAVLAELSHEVSLQQAAEQDLNAARVRAAEIERELQPLRALEQTLRDRQRLLAEAQQRAAALQAEVDAAERAASGKEAELRPRLAALQERLAGAQRLDAAVTAAQAALDAAMPKPPAPAEPKKQ